MLAIKPYVYIAKIRVLTIMTYRFDVISTILLSGIVMIAVSFFWTAVYNGRDSALGITKNAMLIYTIISAAMSSLFTIEVENKIQQAVRKGSIATDMIKPVSLFGMYLAEDLGSIPVNFFQKTVVLLVVGSIFITVPVAVSASSFGLFIVSFVQSYAINWLFSAIFGMWAFTAISMVAISSLKKYVIRLLSGGIIPIWFFPEWLSGIISFLPFPYIYQLPLGIYIGKYTGTEAASLILLQSVWVVILFTIFRLLSRSISKRILVQGG